MIVDIAGRVAGNEFDQSTIRSLCWDATKRRGDFRGYLRSSADSFDAGQCNLVLRRCFMVMAADGQAKPAELQRLAETAFALGVAEDDYAALSSEFLTSPDEESSGARPR